VFFRFCVVFCGFFARFLADFRRWYVLQYADRGAVMTKKIFLKAEKAANGFVFALDKL
jgi:hypothetical protein